MYADPRGLQQHTSLVRFADAALSFVDKAAMRLQLQRAAFVRHAAIHVAEFLADEDVLWYCKHRGYSTEDLRQLVRGALADKLEAIRNARLMIECADDGAELGVMEATQE